MAAAVQINNLYKKFKTNNQVALDHLNLEIQEGELYGLVGPDGAGKSTLFRILSTLILPDEGNATLFNFDVVDNFQDIRKITGYMPGRFSLYMDLSILENLEFFATVFNTSIEENYNLIKDIYQQIEPFKHRRASQLSGGMKQKLALCCTLVHQPKILFLDEPTTGVDPISRKEFWDILKHLKSSGMTIVVSTPYMDEAALCDRISFINLGKILETDSPQKLISNIQEKIYQVQCQEMYECLLYLQQNKLVNFCYTFGDVHHFTLKSDQQHDFLKFQSEINAKGFQKLSWTEVQANLEDCFILRMQKESDGK